ncbi:MAG TPA: hypothetical protein V6C85_12285 [Allocoleopsis sp.]
MNRFPFPLKISIPAILLLFGGELGLVSFQREVYQSHIQAEQDIREQATFLASQMSGLLEYQYRSADGKGAELVISQIATAPNLQLAFLCDENHRVIFSTRFELNKRSVSNTSAAQQLPVIKNVQQTKSGQVVFSKDEQSIRAIYPVVLGALPRDILPSRVGVLFLEYNLSAIKAQAYKNALERTLAYSAMLQGKRI